VERLPTNKAIKLNNLRCPYCNVLLTKENQNEEHVVGRRFLPKGKLKNRWNLILRACKTCNGWKAALEDDISAVTLQPTARGQFARPEEDLVAESIRKARSISRRTGKSVRDSSERFTVEANIRPGLRMTAHLIAQPQADAERIFDLAVAQVMAFCLFLSYDKSTRLGAPLAEDFQPVSYAFRQDWGNTLQRGFIDYVVAWEPRLLAGTGDGLFKVAIRRQPGAVCWSWALEWNENVRVIGFFGAIDAIASALDALPKLDVSWLTQVDGTRTATRIERFLEPSEDRMFFWAEPVAGD